MHIYVPISVYNFALKKDSNPKNSNTWITTMESSVKMVSSKKTMTDGNLVFIVN